MTEKERYEVSPLGLPKPAPKKVDFPMGKSHFFAKLSVLPAPEPAPNLRQICAKFAPNVRQILRQICAKSMPFSSRLRPESVGQPVCFLSTSTRILHPIAPNLERERKSRSKPRAWSSILAPNRRCLHRSAQGLVPRQACKTQ